MIVCSGEEEVLATAEGRAISGTMFGCGCAAGGAIAGARFGCAASGAYLRDSIFGAAMLGETFCRGEAGTGAGRETRGCSTGALGAMRATEEGAAGAERRVKGSRRRNGAGPGIAGATIALR